ncbi:MAG: NAD(P)-dependent oxidoreductase [Pseudomonadota bacterium]
MRSIGRDCAVGFVGLGVMGTPMAGWLLHHKWSVHVHSRRSEPMQTLVSQGAVGVPSPSALGRACQLVLLCVSDDAAVEEVLFGAQGVAHGLAPGGVVVDMSTISPASARRFAQRLDASGSTYLDAPVSGGQPGAVAGTLACMIAGPRSAVDAVRDVLGAFCKTITHVGDTGAGQTVKACNQVAAAGALLGVADAIALARSQGVDPRVMRDVLLSGTARSFVLEKDGQRIIDGSFAPGFRARLMRKDLRIALQAAGGAVPLRTAGIADSLLSELCEARGSELDWSAIGRG